MRVQVPYERVVQWLAGPFAALVAWGATSLVHTSITHDQSVLVATFVLSAAATMASHFKWLTNLAKWWSTAAAGVSADLPEQLPENADEEGLVLAGSEAGEPLPGAIPADQITAAGAPDAEDKP